MWSNVREKFLYHRLISIHLFSFFYIQSVEQMLSNQEILSFTFDFFFFLWSLSDQDKNALRM